MYHSELKNLIKFKKNQYSLLTIAHRGYSGNFKDNSVRAIKEAIKVKRADGVEFDVQSTADEYLIVNHNRAVFINGKYYWIKDLSLEKVRQVLPDEDAPLFEELIGLFKSSDKIIDIDLKSLGITRKIISICKNLKLYDRVIFSTVYKDINCELQTIDPKVARMYGYPQDRGKDLAQRIWTKPLVDIIVAGMKQYLIFGINSLINEANTDFLSLYHKVLSSNVINTIHQNQKYCIGVIINLANDTGKNTAKKTMAKLLTLGIDGIKTDHPDLLI